MKVIRKDYKKKNLVQNIKVSLKNKKSSNKVVSDKKSNRR